MRPGEAAVALPQQADAGVYFIGTIHTPWHIRAECPKRGSFDGPICSIVIDGRWRMALTDLVGHRRLQVLYWMHRARRNLVLQTPFQTGNHWHVCLALTGAAEPDRFLDRRPGSDRRQGIAGAGARLPRRHTFARFEAGSPNGGRIRDAGVTRWSAPWRRCRDQRRGRAIEAGE